MLQISRRTADTYRKKDPSHLLCGEQNSANSVPHFRPKRYLFCPFFAQVRSLNKVIMDFNSAY